ncbi:NAD-dependent epimerase/dehydratase family protein [Nitratireductor sp. CAU 1489]|uniref:NAD-dependent epimerase/dehydratase family protein n=1 Tax=Nitratireductor arenosus TaxID=2682096 RepID=A0A844QAR9_9HYPH|nr:D-erythronate dehydrogenase [Nitratireductor arenosus]MVA95744.1 NAD-dependent epimerase/dehydratase family protein [Nitratireductor arenosus]
MRVLVTGAAGMIGRKLVARLARDGALNGRRLAALDLHDIVSADAPAINGATVSTHIGDLAAPGEADRLVAAKPDMVFHLAGVVSAEAEADFDKGYRVNLDGTRALFDAIRAAGHAPRVVFSSSIAVFGAPFPDTIPDDFHPTPLTSYGTQKLIGEALLADYSRRGFLDGIGLRLPTICVRPGKPNKAASSFFSAIIRDPLAGRQTMLPVPRSVLHTHASPRAAVGFLLHAAGLAGEAVGPRRNLTMPGVACTVGEQIEALERIAGSKAVGLIREQHDEAVWAIVRNWPTRFMAERARALGFEAEESFDEIVTAHIEDEFGEAS